MKKLLLIVICIGILPFISSFGTLIDPDSVLSETQVEAYINNSDFSFSPFNVTAGGLTLLGDSYFSGHLFPLTTLNFDIGSATNRWRWIYAQNISVDFINIAYNLDVTGNVTAGGYLLGDGSFLTGVNVTDIWVNESGDTMTGSLNLGGNNITNIWHTYSEDFYIGNYLQEQGDSGTFIQFPGDRHIHTYAGGYPVAEFIGGTPKGFLLLGDGLEEVDLVVYGSINQALFHADSVNDRVNISGSVNVEGNITADWGFFDNLNVTGTSYLGDIVIEAENITATNFFGTFTGNSSIWSRAGTYVFPTNIGDRIGIGTTSPVSHLHIDDSSAQAIFKMEGDGGSILEFTDSTANSNEKNYQFRSDDGEFRLDLLSDTRDYFVKKGIISVIPDGNVGIGNTIPNATLHVSGDIIASGNITAGNVFLPSFVFAHTNNTIPVTIAGVWYNVTFDEEVSDPKLRITHTHSDNTNDTFTIVDDGYYNIHYAMSFSSAQATPTSHIVMRVTKNAVEIEGSLLEEDATKQYSDFTISNGPIVYLVTGDEIVFQFTSDDTDVSLTSHRTYGDHHDTAIVKIIKIAN